LQFLTRSLPCLTEYYNLFYLNGKKIVPNNIHNLFNEVAFTHWICGDGTPTQSGGLTLCTDSYTLLEVNNLINVLIIRYDLICTIHTHRENQYRIHISKKSMNIVRTLVSNHMPNSMKYKIKL
jgi:hypothetical protein